MIETRPTPTIYLLLFMLAAGLNACATQSPVKSTSNANDYPTQARVEYVLQCMQKNGGQTYDTLYPCVCSIDKIADSINYDDYAEAQTFTYMRSAPGEAGGLFRDPPRAKELRKRLQEIEANAKSFCFVRAK